MRQQDEASIFNLIACAAAFTVVALIILFGHPAKWGAPATRMTVNAGAGAQVISAPTAAGESTDGYRASR
jgi:hypothetical protein